MSKDAKKIVKEISKLIGPELEDRETVKLLKKIFIHKQRYNISASLRDLETALWPECNTKSPEVEKAASFKTVLNIADFEIKETKTAYILLALAELYLEKEQSTDIEKITDIKAQANKIFGE